METIFRFLWVGYFAAAYLLMRYKRGNWAIILGLIGSGLPNFIYSLVGWEIIRYSDLAEYRQALQTVELGADILLVLGIVMLAWGGRSNRPSRDAGRPWCEPREPVHPTQPDQHLFER